MAKKKRQRAPTMPSASIDDGKENPWYKKTWPWVAGFTVAVSWVLLNGVSALSNAEKLPSAVSNLYEKISTWYRTDQNWTGKWTNEGDIDARHSPDIFVDLDLLVQDRNVQGTIGSGPQRDATPLNFVLVEGAVVDDTLDVLAFDYVHGVPKRIATFKITRVDSHGLKQIKIVTTWQAQPWFPNETILWRSGETELLPDLQATDS